MNNCDLDKLAISSGKLEPAFEPGITKYKASVSSAVQSISLSLQTSDTGASYSIRGGDGSKVIKLKDGVNTVSIEVTAEDGTIKIYVIEVTKLAANAAFLQGLTLTEDIQLVPSFASNVYEYTCMSL